MNINFIKKLTAISLAALMTVSLASCGKGNPPKAPTTNMFSQESINIDFGKEIDYVNNFAAGDNQFYLVYDWSEKVEIDPNERPEEDFETDYDVDDGVVFEEDTEIAITDDIAVGEATIDDSDVLNMVVTTSMSFDEAVLPDDGKVYQYIRHTYFSAYDFEGKVLFEVDLTPEEEDDFSGWTNYGQINPNADGTVSIMKTVSTWDDDTYEETSENFIITYDNSGNITNTAKLEFDTEDYEYGFNPQDYIVDAEGNMYFQSYDGVIALSADGKQIFSSANNQEDMEKDSHKNINGITKARDGFVYILGNTYTYDEAEGTSTEQNYAQKIDLQTGKFGEEIPLKGNYYNTTTGTDDYDVLINQSEALYGCNFDVGVQEVVVNWLSSGIDSTEFRYTANLANGDFVAFIEDYDENPETGDYEARYEVKYLKRRDPSEVKEKELVTVASNYGGYDVFKMIAHFNEQSDDYVVEFISYEKYNDPSTGDWEAAAKQLNNDLVAGKVPDILLISDAIPLQNYISKGILSDLYDFIEDDEDIDMDDYLPNIIEALTIDEKLYSFTPSFSLRSFIAKSSIVGERPGITLDKFKNVMEEYPNSLAYDYMTKENFLSQAIQYFENFQVNEENKDDLKNILEIANTLPDEIDWDARYSDGDFYNQPYLNDRIIFNDYYFSTFDRFARTKYGDFGGQDVTFTGFPNSQKYNSVISPAFEFAITSKAQNPDGAWAFAKQFFGENEQYYDYTLPTMKKYYDEMLEEAMKEPDEDHKDYFWRNNSDEPIEIPPISEADAKQLMDVVESASLIVRYDHDLNEIISEEASAYFSGQKSVDEVVEIILNRANIYISENS